MVSVSGCHTFIRVERDNIQYSLYTLPDKCLTVATTIIIVAVIVVVVAVVVIIIIIVVILHSTLYSCSCCIQKI